MQRPRLFHDAAQRWPSPRWRLLPRPAAAVDPPSLGSLVVGGRGGAAHIGASARNSGPRSTPAPHSGTASPALPGPRHGQTETRAAGVDAPIPEWCRSSLFKAAAVEAFFCFFISVVVAYGGRGTLLIGSHLLVACGVWVPGRYATSSNYQWRNSGGVSGSVTNDVFG